MNPHPFLTEQWASAYFQILFSTLVFAIGIPFLGLQLVQEDVRHIITYRTWKTRLYLVSVFLLFLSAISFVWFLHPVPPADKLKEKEAFSSAQTRGEDMTDGTAAASPPAADGAHVPEKVKNFLLMLDNNYEAYIAGAFVTVLPILTITFGYLLSASYTRRKLILQFRNDIVRGFNRRGTIDKRTLEKIAYLGEHGNSGIEKKYVLDAYQYIAHEVQKKPVRFEHRFMIAAHEYISAKWPEDKPGRGEAKAAIENRVEADADSDGVESPEAASPARKKKFHRCFNFFESLRRRIPDAQVGYMGRELEEMIRSLLPILQYREKPGNDENFMQTGELLKNIWKNVSGEVSNQDATLSAFTLKQLGLIAIKENSEVVALMYINLAAAAGDDAVVFELGLGALRAGLDNIATFALSRLERLALAEEGGVLGANETTYNFLGLAAHFMESGASGRRLAMRFLSPHENSFSPSVKECLTRATDYHFLTAHYKTSDQLYDMSDLLDAPKEASLVGR